MTPTVKTLENGARLILAPNAHTRTVSVVPGIHIGSRFEPKEIGGLSHFVEHLLFRGTAKYPSSEKVSRAIDRLGGYINASTDTEMTDIQVMTADANQATCADVAMELLCAGLFKDEDIEQERGVVCDEIKMYESNDGKRGWQILQQALFGDHPFGRPIAGYVENIYGVTPDRIRAFQSANYVPEQIVVTLAGNFSEATQAYVEGRLLAMPRATAGVKRPVEAPARHSAPTTLVSDANEPRSALYVGFQGPSDDPRARTALALLGEVLGGYMSSRLFVELRDKLSLCYSIGAYFMPASDASYLAIATKMEPIHLPKAIKALGFELRRVLEDLTEEELDAAKSYTVGSTVISNESSSHVATHMTHDLLVRGRVESTEEKLARYQSITLDEVRQAARGYLRNARTAIVTPSQHAKGIEEICANELGSISA